MRGISGIAGTATTGDGMSVKNGEDVNGNVNDNGNGARTTKSVCVHFGQEWHRQRHWRM